MNLRRKNKLVHGFGVNDADYQVYTRVGSVRTICPFYRKWTGMLERCFSEKLKLKHKTYEGCEVSEEWLSFMSFKRWMELQDWKGLHLDKDLKVIGNKLYSKDTCLMLDNIVNQFLNDQKFGVGYFPLGVTFKAETGKFVARCHAGGVRLHLGYFDCPYEAENAYLLKKSEVAMAMALMYDGEIKDSLVRLASNLKSKIKGGKCGTSNF